MNDLKITIGVEVTQREDGRFYFNLLADESVNLESIRSILAGGLMLSILAEKTPESQAKAMEDVINYMSEEFISVDAFKDKGGPAIPAD
jgi:hypothetical protein